MELLQVETSNVDNAGIAPQQQNRFLLRQSRAVCLVVVVTMCVSMVLLWPVAPAALGGGNARIAGESLRDPAAIVGGAIGGHKNEPGWQAFMALPGLLASLPQRGARIGASAPALRLQPAVRPAAVRMGLLDGLTKGMENLIGATEATGINIAPSVAAADQTLTWVSGVSEVPDPRHAMEDAWFAGDYDFGVFDGVSGSQKNQFGDLYSFQLSSTVYSMLVQQRQKRGVIDTELALEYAYQALNAGSSLGSTTATFVTLDTQSEPGFTVLKGSNVGDSGVIVLRQGGADGRPFVAYKTIPQMHFFNCPFQLGGSSPDGPDLATKIRVPLVSGDIVVLATDGVYDNVYESQIVDLVEATLDEQPNVMAQALVAYARQVQEDPNAYVPYGVEAAAAGKEWTGGKLDDTLALVLKFQ